MISVTLNLNHDRSDEISLYVQQIGGHFEIHKHVVEFYIPAENFDFIMLKYPFLKVIEYIW